MSDHHTEHLAEVDEGKSLLPEIVQKEHELQTRLEAAKAEADRILKDAEAAREKQIEAARTALPGREDAYAKEKVASFSKEIAAFEKTERTRLAELESKAKGKLSAATDAVLALVLPKAG